MKEMSNQRLSPFRLLCGLGLGVGGRGTLWAQSLELTPQQTKGTIGDRITFDVRVRLRAGMELIDAVPHTLIPPPPGIRLLAADTLRPEGGGTYHGTATFAFYRIGPQPVPTLALLYRIQPGAPPDTLLHLPVSIEIVPTLEPGNPSLRDIKPLQAVGGPVWGQLAGLLAAIAGGIWWLYRRKGPVAATLPSTANLTAGPFDAALARLEDLERAARQSGNGVVPLYASVAEVVRDCLLQVGAIPHRGLTTAELGRSLPSALSTGDLRDRCTVVLSDADLVKFARVRPDLAAAGDHVARTRSLLEAWRTAAGSIDAIR